MIELVGVKIKRHLWKICEIKGKRNIGRKKEKCEKKQR